jgi:hypothetical protein
MAESKIVNIVNSVINFDPNDYELNIKIIDANRRVILEFHKKTGDEGSYRVDFQSNRIYFQDRNRTTWETIYQV